MNDLGDVIDNFLLAGAAFGVGYFLGGSWQHGLGTLLLQFVWAKNATSVLTAQAKIAKLSK